MTKILITGASGFLGSRVSKELCKKHNVTCFIKGDANKLKGLKVKLIYGDMMDKGSVFSAVKNKEVVIHLAHSNKTEDDVTGARNLIEACKKDNTRIIFTSSMAVKRNHLDDYGKMKLKIEEMIKKSGLNYTLLRLSMVYDECKLPMVDKAFRIPFVIPIISSGRYKLGLVHIKDVVRIISKVIEEDISFKKTYEVASRLIEYNDIIKAYGQQKRIKKPIIHIPKSICILIFRIFPIFNIETIKGIDQSSNPDVSLLKKDFKINLIDFYEGVKLLKN